MVLLQLGMLAGSLAVLILASELVINASIALARYLRISELAIGFIMLSVATAFPELAVSLVAALDGHVDIAVGNILGASIADMTFNLAIPALVVGYVAVRKKELLDVVKILFVTSILPLLLVLYKLSNFVVGITLLYVFFLYAYFVLRQGLSLEKAKKEEVVTPSQAFFSGVWLLVGLVLLSLSASFAVENAARLASLAGLSQVFIGATILALGTSLPEVTVNLLAIRKGHPGLVIGATLGSSITNLSLLLGFVALINPLTTNLASFVNLIIFLIIANILLWYFMQSKLRIERWEGAIMLLLYAAFILSTLGVEVGF
jgi:cation:H+ antiporter